MAVRQKRTCISLWAVSEGRGALHPSPTSDPCADRLPAARLVHIRVNAAFAPFHVTAFMKAST